MEIYTQGSIGTSEGTVAPENVLVNEKGSWQEIATCVIEDLFLEINKEQALSCHRFLSISAL